MAGDGKERSGRVPAGGGYRPRQLMRGSTKGATYKAAGVDIQAGYEAVRRIKPLAASTFRPEVLDGIGSFGGFFALPEGRYREPVLVSGTDGVGTKLKVAFLMDKHDTVGVDVVAYCVNDIICHGAEPLFFLDYLALGRVRPELVETIVAGVAEGCRQAGCSLVGGETAEMPGLYSPGEYDLAGFAVGVVERTRLINGARVSPGDMLVGIRSTGLQSSGYSLTRKVLLETAGMKIDQRVPELGKSLGEELLTPTGIYARQVLRLAGEYDLRGAANVSGGGLVENVPRALAPGTRAVIRKASFEVHPIFRLIQRMGRVSEDEMYRTYNMGIAMVMVVPPGQAAPVVKDLAGMGEKAWVIGSVQEGEPGVSFA